MATIQCSGCGNRIIQKGEKCPHCGEPVPLDETIILKNKEPKKEESLISCSTCGKNISKNADKCPHCGEPVPKKNIAGVWNMVLLIIVTGWVFSVIYKDDKKSTPLATSTTYSKPITLKKEKRNTLKGGYFACTTEDLYDEIISAAVDNDNLAVGHLLTKGCVLTKAGVRMSIIDIGFMKSKIRAYIEGESIVVYTSTENVYY